MAVRLQKAIADAGITSRRKAETLIESGRVFLNDKKAKLGDKYLSGDKIYIDGKEIKFISLNKDEDPDSFIKNNGKEAFTDKIKNAESLANFTFEYYEKNDQYSNKSTLMLPSQNVVKSIKIYKKLLDSDNLINKKIIDLRITNQIILTNNNE